MLVPFRLVTQRVCGEERVLRDENRVYAFFPTIYFMLLISKDEMFTAGQRKKKVFSRI